MSAQFPNAVKNFVTINPGDLIQPSFGNDLQDEVHAIEAGYLQGTAPLNSSNSTVASLVVSSNLTVQGTVTAPNLFLATVCHLSHSLVQDIPSNTFTGLVWNTETRDGSSMHSTSVNSSRITFSASSGLYLVGLNLAWSQQSAAGPYFIRIVANDAQAIGAQGGSTVAAGSNPVPMSVTAMFYATSTSDYVTAQAFNGAVSTNSIVSDSTLYGTKFWACRVG
jgi:hypothetical protein